MLCEIHSWWQTRAKHKEFIPARTQLYLGRQHSYHKIKSYVQELLLVCRPYSKAVKHKACAHTHTHTAHHNGSNRSKTKDAMHLTNRGPSAKLQPHSIHYCGRRLQRQQVTATLAASLCQNLAPSTGICCF
jgi:hypothetical protein